MKSNNPVFRHAAGFRNNTVQTNPYAPSAAVSTDPMTIDTVVQKTSVTLTVVVITAALTWLLTPSIAENNIGSDNLSGLYAAMTIGGLGAFVLSMVNSFKHVITPALVLAFAVFEGVSLGAYSKFFDAMYSNDGHGLVTGAVLGTFAAFAGTLAAYKFFDIHVTGKFRTIVMAAVFGMVGLSVLELVLSVFGASLGLFDLSAVGFMFSFVGLVLGIFMLILDFDFVEQGIANNLPEQESWRAAFAMTVSLVWIYTNLLRLLAIISRR